MKMERFRIGYDVTILWSVTDKKGVALPLTDKEVHLYYTCERGRFEADIEIQDDNVVVWHFLNKEQRVLGSYGLTLEVLQSDGKRAIRKDICEAFTLVGKSCFEETEGEANVLEGGEIVLSSELDIYRISPIVPTIGPNGNWWIDGKDSGYLASTARNNIRELFIPEIGFNVDGSYSITQELTSEQKAYNAETAAILKNGQRPLLFSPLDGIVNYFVLADGKYFFYVKQTFFTEGTIRKVICLLESGDIEFIGVLPYASMYDFRNREEVEGYVKCLDKLQDTLAMSTVYSSPINSDTNYPSVVDRLYWEGDVLAIEFNYEDKRYKQTFNKETGEMVHEETLSSSGLILRTVCLPETDEDGNIVTPLTDEEKAYNAETVRLIMGPKGGTTVISLGGVTFAYALVGPSRIECNAKMAYFDLLFAVKFNILFDGSIESPEYAECPTMCFFSNPENIKAFFDYTRLTGVYEPHRIVPAKGYSDGYGMVYSFCGDVLDGKEVMKIHYYDAYGRQWYDYYDLETYEFISKHEVETGGGTGIDLEALEGYLPMSRDFSDDFNNDFAR
jgi:hypothetical protein